MGRVHYFVLLLVVLYFPLRVNPGPIKDGDVTSGITTETDDPFKAVDMISLYRSSNIPAKRKTQRAKAKKKLTNVRERTDEESTCSSSDSESSDSADDNSEGPEHSDGVSDSHSDREDSPDIADDSELLDSDPGARCCCSDYNSSNGNNSDDSD
ncbi:hypothetical protein OS493_008153 [Desmophyllum pertusum]|uniref:Uncharacterized protein n=1 Tax=Desmophyllum pertusum TaxID=174260 RepID=A0A9X0A3R0_9CNID|nr:hypothetical protein OS493_008153 [Desmophyllum pertusum]